MSWDNVDRLPELQTKYGQGSGGNAAVCASAGCRLTSSSWGKALAAGTKTYDHAGEMFRTGGTFDNTIGLSGGTERSTFYLSAGRSQQLGIVTGPNNFYDRKTVLVKGDLEATSRLRIGGSINYIDARGGFVQRGSNVSGLLLGAWRTPPEFNNAVYLDSTTGFHRSYRYPRPTAAGVTRGYDNPFFVANNGGVNVDATAPSIVASALTVRATGDSTLYTNVGSLSANITGAGNTLTVSDDDGLTISSISTNGGAVDVEVGSVAPSLMTLAGAINAGAGSVNLRANAIQGGGTITGDVLSVTVARSSNLATNVNAIQGTINGPSGFLTVTDTSGLLIGAADLTATGANSRITLNANGVINGAGNVYANAAGGTIVQIGRAHV